MHRAAFYPLMGASGGGKQDYWYAEYNFSDAEQDLMAFSFDVDSKDNIYFGGHSTDVQDPFYGKLNSKGEVVWCKQMTSVSSGQDLSYARFVGVGSSDDQIFIGYGPASGGYFGAKITEDGDFVWQTSYLHGNVYIQQGAINKENNTFILGGFVFRDFTGQLGDTAVAQFDENGSVDWSRGYGTNAHDGRSNCGIGYTNNGDITVAIGVNPHGASIDTMQFTTWNDNGGTRIGLYGIGGGGGRPIGPSAFHNSDSIISGVSFAGGGWYIGKYTPNVSTFTEDWSMHCSPSTTCIQSLQSTRMSPDDSVLYQSQQLRPGNREQCHILAHDSDDGTVLWQNVWRDPNDTFNVWCNCLVIGEDYIVVGGMKNTNGDKANMWMAKVPMDGTGQGVYGDLEYQVSPIVVNNTSPGSGTRYLNVNATNWATPASVTTTVTDKPLNTTSYSKI